MKIYAKIALLSLILIGFSACGGGNGDATSGQQFKVIASKDKGYAEVFLVPADNTATDPANNTPKSDTSTELSHQTIVSGKISGEGVSGGILVEALEAETCAQGYCPSTSKGALASTKVNQAGFYSIIVPSSGQAVIVRATFHPASGNSLSAQKYLGVLEARIDDADLALK